MRGGRGGEEVIRGERGKGGVMREVEEGKEVMRESNFK